ncbi:MAG: response regulator [SAR324 cluster bacterium]|nr:response regulator [SAR324 cluster bacterium]
MEFNIRIAEDVPDALLLDETRLRQILINLLGNAFKFTDQGGVELLASSTLLPDRSRELVLSVRDTGIGIPEDQQRKIFEAFEQQEGQDENRYGGTGLGLAIIKKIVDTMGGRITVVSKKGEGSTFTIVLNGVQISSALESIETSEYPIARESVVFGKATILIVEDIPLDIELIKTYLNFPELEILEAVNGEMCIKIAKQRNPDLILMDMKMPVMDGFNASETLKSDPLLKDIPIIAVTALKKDEERVKKLCNSYIQKPVSREELTGELMKYLQYTTVPSSHSDDDSADVLPFSFENPDKETATRLPDLFQTLEHEITPQWEQREMLSVDQIEEFVKRIIELGESSNYLPLKQWGSKLKEFVEIFDMENLEKTMNGFPQIKEMLKKFLLPSFSSLDKE